ncbi:MAG: nicotinate-nucleotide--dimethylbenzimidazole phosphoribosyltransferase [Dehalococcoidia bacterium]|nr:nicotinate-nucleotide--dimethylbenzimidazole phosphoribosyltransferase [Dehalococcoidia bacterium]
MASLEKAIQKIGPLDEEAMKAARERQDELTKPQGSLGRLEELSIKVAGIRGEATPLEHKAIIVMAADHGVVAEGVSLFPQEVTAQMVQNFLHGGAGINVLARHVGARVVVVDMGVAAELETHPHLISRKVALGTRNMMRGPAMSRAEAISAVEAGIEIMEREFEKGLDIVGTGDMGIANTTPSSAITAAITGEAVAEVTGRGTGIGDSQLAHKVRVIEETLKVNQPDPNDGLDVLAKVGGFEIGGLVGVMIGAAAHRIPIVIDGFVSGAAALIATRMAPKLSDFLIAAHLSAEIGHEVALKHLGLKPILDLRMRLGEGTGAALAIFIIEAAVRTLAEMATFSGAGVSEAEKRRVDY